MSLVSLSANALKCSSCYNCPDPYISKEVTENMVYKLGVTFNKIMNPERTDNMSCKV